MIDAIKIDTSIPLNKRVAQSRLCARRKAAILVKDGLIRVNGTIIKEPGYRVSTNDIIVYQKKVLPLQVEKNIYLMLNKPRKRITTLSDEQERASVIDLLPAHLQHKVFPIGRLDKETTGLLLLTNDGALAHALSHPSTIISKTYHVTLDRAMPEELIFTLQKGVYLSDGLIRVDRITYASEHDKSQLTITLHSGKNKIIKRLCARFGFWVKKLDRINYARLTSRGLAKGYWRHLTTYEINLLKKNTKK